MHAKHGNGLITELRGVSKEFVLPGGRELRVLEHINLQVRESEVVALLGPSGSGKSTLLRILAGLIAPSTGQVFYRDKPLQGLNPAVSVVFQNVGLFPWLTVEENIAEVAKSIGLRGEQRRERVEKVIDLIGLEGFEELYPRELSGGMKQRVGIARALVVEPEILCLDEPFSQLDALTAESLRAELIGPWLEEERNPKSIFIVSHDIKEVVALATRIVIMGGHPGRVLSMVDNPVEYTRDFRDPALARLQERIHDLLTAKIMPDEEPRMVAVPGREEPVEIEAIPPVDTNEIIGLLEMLEDRGGEVNIFSFANELGLEFGQAISVAKAAEMLDFVDTPRQRVLLMPLGREFLKADVNERKAIWGRQSLRIRLFQIFKNMVELASPEGIPEETVLDEISMLLPTENAEDIFEFLTSWGQYGELFRYDPEDEALVPFETPEEAEEREREEREEREKEEESTT